MMRKKMKQNPRQAVHIVIAMVTTRKKMAIVCHAPRTVPHLAH